ncbi:myb_DNA-bind_5 domain-containing protein [Trichonephila clavipes]|nr:myb_DNA-bind_5 domain-containing protein [Trichonephila clavipes]
MAKKSSVLRQERRQTGGGEVPKEAELTDFEMRFSEEPILTLPLSTPFDSDSTDIEISSKTSIPQYINFCFVDSPVTPSQNTEKITEYDSSSDPSLCSEKRAKTPTAPSAAARAAACIEEEHRMKIKYMEMDEERKNEEHQLRMEQLSNNMKMDEEHKLRNEEHKLRMELLRIKIAHAKEKMEVQKILVTTLKDSPKIYLQNTE